MRRVVEVIVFVCPNRSLLRDDAVDLDMCWVKNIKCVCMLYAHCCDLHRTMATISVITAPSGVIRVGN